MKTNEELNKLKQEYEALNDKLEELTDDELNTVTGGISRAILAEAPGFAVAKPGQFFKGHPIGLRGAEQMNEENGPVDIISGIPLDSDSQIKS